MGVKYFVRNIQNYLITDIELRYYYGMNLRTYELIYGKYRIEIVDETSFIMSVIV